MTKRKIRYIRDEDVSLIIFHAALFAAYAIATVAYLATH